MRFYYILLAIFVLVGSVFFHITNLADVQMAEILTIPIWKMVLKSFMFLMFLMIFLRIRDVIIHHDFSLEELKSNKNLALYYSITFGSIAIGLGFIIALV